MSRASTTPSPPNVDSVNERLAELTRQIERVFVMLCVLTERVAAIETEPQSRRREGDEDFPRRPPGVWISLKEAAFQSGKSLAWLHKYRGKGEIAEHSEGGHVLVNVESLNRAIVRSGRTQGTVKYSHHDKQT
jgi:hypothetical protein